MSGDTSSCSNRSPPISTAAAPSCRACSNAQVTPSRSRWRCRRATSRLAQPNFESRWTSLRARSFTPRAFQAERWRRRRWASLLENRGPVLVGLLDVPVAVLEPLPHDPLVVVQVELAVHQGERVRIGGGGVVATHRPGAVTAVLGRVLLGVFGERVPVPGAREAPVGALPAEREVLVAFDRFPFREVGDRVVAADRQVAAGGEDRILGGGSGGNAARAAMAMKAARAVSRADGPRRRRRCGVDMRRVLLGRVYSVAVPVPSGFGRSGQ